jgi:hypothetical protein
MVNMTEEEIQKILNPEDYQSEVVSFNILGLHEAALETAERNVKACEDRSSLYEAVVAAISNKCYALAAQYADRLKLTQNLNKGDIHIISLAYNYAGRRPEAYILCRQAVLRDESPDCTDFYSLACRGSKIHRLEEALIHILRAFSWIEPPHTYLLRKAFLDSELAEVWNHAETSSPNLHRALGVHFQQWKSIVTKNQFAEPERMVDHADLKQIPEEFHILLTSCSVSTFETAPLKSAQYPELHRRYLDWQASTAAPRIAAFARYMENADRELINAQPLFAQFQAEKKRFGLARSHLLCILRNSADCDPSSLPDIPLLAPLLEEFRAQYQESPEAFQYLVNRSVDVTQEVLAKFPPLNRSSGLAALYLGNNLHYKFRFEEAIKAWIECSKIWPWDESPTLNIVFALQLVERFEDATKALSKVPPESLPESTRRLIQENIINRDSSKNPCRQKPNIPTPEFDGFFPGANDEFIEWLENQKTH